MRLCIPVRAPNGLESCVEPYLPDAEHLLFFDTGTREIRHVALRGHVGDGAGEPPFDVVLCESFDEATRTALAEKGIRAFGTDARTAAQAIAEFEAINPGKEHDAGHCGQGRSIGAIYRKTQADALRIAVSSQDRRTITDHALRCRRFWVYDIRGDGIDGKSLRELTPEQTLHASELGENHPLDDVHVMITAGMSPFLYQRLRRGGIKPYVTEESDPDRAVRMLLEKVAGVER
jgi:predicted Fe-Mo cluster-binding NifX family protein